MTNKNNKTTVYWDYVWDNFEKLADYFEKLKVARHFKIIHSNDWPYPVKGDYVLHIVIDIDDKVSKEYEYHLTYSEFHMLMTMMIEETKDM